MQSNYKPLGKYIKEAKNRNTNGSVNTLLGVNIDKYFMPSVANIVGTDLTKYKVVKQSQFACNRMHVGRDKRLPVALSTSEDAFLVSPAYDVFEIVDENTLNPEYLMMWFSRKEFDRNAWFYTDADVRGGLHWKVFCEMTLFIPSIEKQKEIVAEYNIIVDRIKLNEQLNQKLEETAQAIYKQWFVDFEFPDENGKPYKSSGGEMEYNNELNYEIPKGWYLINWSEISSLEYGKGLRNYRIGQGDVPVYGTNGQVGLTNKPLVAKPGIVIGRKGVYRGVHFSPVPFWVIDTAFYFEPKVKLSLKWAFFELLRLDINSLESGSAIPSTSRDDFYEKKCVLPLNLILDLFESLATILHNRQVEIQNQNKLLFELVSVLNGKISIGNN